MSDLSDLFARPDWHSLGACHGRDVDVWFPERGAPGKEAKAVCAECSVKAECLEEALANNERFGVFGGLTPKQRLRLRRERGMAVPPAWRRGENGEKVLAIRVEFQALTAQGVPRARDILGARYGMSRSAVGLIVTGRSYPDRPGPIHVSNRTRPLKRDRAVKDGEVAA